MIMSSFDNNMKSSLNASSDGTKKIPTVSESSIPNSVSQTPSKPPAPEPKKKGDAPPPSTPSKPPVAAAESKKKVVVEVPNVVTPECKSKLLVKKLDPSAVLPERKSVDAAGYDICCLEKRVIIPPNSHKLISTGLSFTVPEGTYGQLASRSGLCSKGVTVQAGVIDRDYTGEVKVLLFNHTSEKVYVNEKDRIAQLLVKKIDLPVVEEVDTLESTDRGVKGFGSTG